MYYIPRLRSHIISLGQLDESGCQVLIQNGVLRVRDRERRLLAKVQRAPNRLYSVALRIAQPVYLAAHSDGDTAWT